VPAIKVSAYWRSHLGWDRPGYDASDWSDPNPLPTLDQLLSILGPLFARYRAKTKVEHHNYQDKGTHHFDGGITTSHWKDVKATFATHPDVLGFLTEARPQLDTWFASAPSSRVSISLEGAESIDLDATNDVDTAIHALQVRAAATQRAGKKRRSHPDRVVRRT